MANVVVVNTKDEFERLVSLSGLIVVHFTAEWAQQCRQINDVLTELSNNKDYSYVHFAKIDAESLADVSQTYQISSVPTCLLLSNGKLIERIEGANVPLLTKRVKQESFKLSPLSSTSPVNNGNNINERLKSLVNKSPVMVFMKGSPNAPRCGFSRTLVSILGELNVKYETFDILEDEDVRQALKAFSNWPTYPQVYVKGNFIGGLDIIKELKETGELEEVLNAN